MCKKFFTFLLIFFGTTNLYADLPHYIDFKFILNESSAGKKAQDHLKNKFNKGIENIDKKKKSLQEEERKIIDQKKLIKPEEYKEKVNKLRTKVQSLQKERNQLLESVSKQRNKAKSELLKALNPIISNYMKEKKIRMVIDKKNLLLADDALDITKDIINLLNKNLKTIKLN